MLHHVWNAWATVLQRRQSWPQLIAIKTAVAVGPQIGDSIFFGRVRDRNRCYRVGIAPWIEGQIFRLILQPAALPTQIPTVKSRKQHLRHGVHHPATVRLGDGGHDQEMEMTSVERLYLSERDSGVAAGTPLAMIEDIDLREMGFR
ncbi:uncharacterized protein N7482_000035 [Penicillium canariense]|uniref:Uncharacterized protein n=1 Tax=Penicillium canariense TaxID=189055 RepID=A0A9W9IAN9_9EURO|nr:uncharacterized protein N7482_000035 [Penicillium canariense]KAJ5174158.1 hypothetical protein N7482_000035 [Penicillium canariense]